MLLRIDGEVLHLVGVALEIEELDIVDLEDPLQGPRLVVLLG